MFCASARTRTHTASLPPSPSSAVVKVTTSLDGNGIRERERGIENHAILKSLFTHNLTPTKKPMLLIWISAFKDTSASRHMGADTESILLVLIRSGFGFKFENRCGLVSMWFDPLFFTELSGTCRYRVLFKYLNNKCTLQ